MITKPTAEEIRCLLICDAATGKLVWRARTPSMFKGNRIDWQCRKWNGRYAGKEAGHLTAKNYRTIRIFDRSYLEHHVVWLIVHGEWPTQLDHRLGAEHGNGIDNLRVATQSENMQNSRKRRDNKSGFKGVSWDAINHKWVARIRVPKGKYENLGRFDTSEEAHEAYCHRARKLFGSFARFV